MAQLAALLLALFGLLPIANWIAGGHAAPWYHDRLRLWAIGTVVVGTITLLIGVAIRRRPQLWNNGAWERTALRWQGAGRRADGALALVAGLTYAAIARLVFSARPLLIDEIIQLYQGRIFASGHLFLPTPQYPEFSSAMNLIDTGGKVYGQFPPGGPAMLALGTLLHAEWLVGPLAAAVTVFALARLFRRIESRPGVSLAATVLFAFAPFTCFLSGSMMNHVTTVMWITLACLALSHATAPVARARPGSTPDGIESLSATTAPVARARPGSQSSTEAETSAASDIPAAQRAAATGAWPGIATGLALGVAATIRPLDALAFAFPAGAWLLWRAIHGTRAELRVLLWSGVGIAIPLALLFWVNSVQGGGPLQFGYLTMWGKSHEIGFHEAPWGFPHTPLRGLELINLYLLRLQTWFFEAPLPSLLFATLALALTRTLKAFDRYLLCASGLLLLAYFAYWHDGFYLGPRFVYPLAPWLALWTARLPSVLTTRGASLQLQRLTITAGVTALLLGGLVLLPVRLEQYQQGMSATRIDADAVAREAGVHDAIVLVRESWGAQLYARLWALGVSRIQAHEIFSQMDLCHLDQLLDDAEARRSSTAAFLSEVRPIAAATRRLVRLRTVGDSAIHLMAGAVVTPRCLRRIRENQAGFTTFPPMLLAGASGNLFARELHARDSLLLRLHPGKPVYLLLRDTTARSPLRLLPVALDSARNEWQAANGAPE